MDYDLKQLQRVILVIAKELKRLCDENNIRYTLIGGSLIGAVRHQGFIPWDDDFDVVMPREDYERFLECCKTKLNPEFSVLNWNTSDSYFMAFSKILLKGTEAVTEMRHNPNYPREIFIDVFPFDTIPDDAKLRKKQEKSSYFCKKMLLCKQNGKEYYKHFNGGKKVGYFFMGVASHFYNSRKLIERYEQEMNRYKGDTLDYTSITGSYGYSKEIIPHHMLENFIELPFEDTSFSVMRDYDYYLKMVFGDYMQLPPEDKRHTHSFKRVDFGKYSDV